MHSHHDHDHHHHHGGMGHLHITDLSTNLDSQKRLKIVLVVTLIFMVIEAVGGYLSNSLALISDSAHMLTDSTALVFALVSLKISQKPSTDKHSFGLLRAEILGAFVNGLLLSILALRLFYEAWERFKEPGNINGSMMITIAFIGLLVNIVGGYILMKGNKDSIAMRGAILHVAGDALGSVGAVIAGGLILLFNWVAADLIVTGFIASIILYSAFGFLRETTHVILQGTPSHIKLDRVRFQLLKFDEVSDLHDLHVWTLSPGHFILTVHLVYSSEDPDGLLQKIQEMLNSDFGISHSTIQLECKNLDDGCRH